MNESVIVSIDAADNGDTAVLIVGKQVNGKVTILNAFSGDEAIAIYKKLTEVRK